MISVLRFVFLFLTIILMTGYFVTPTMSALCNCKRIIIPHMCWKKCGKKG
nr:anthophilin [Apis mellifera]WAJ59851.1 anthophilin [Apis mellifera]